MEDENRIQQADRRRAKSPETMSPLFRQLQQEEFLKYEQRLADEEEARLFEKWGEAGLYERIHLFLILLYIIGT